VSKAVQEEGRPTVEAADPGTALGLCLVIELTGSGLVRLRTSVRNGGDDDYRVDAVSAVLPVPERAADLLDLTGRTGEGFRTLGGGESLLTRWPGCGCPRYGPRPPCSSRSRHNRRSAGKL
jgi:hypothetical protein